MSNYNNNNILFIWHAVISKHAINMYNINNWYTRCGGGDVMMIII